MTRSDPRVPTNNVLTRICATPSAYVRPQPHNVRPHPHNVRPHPHNVRSHPHNVRPHPHNKRRQPHNVRTHSHNVRPHSHIVRPHSHNVWPHSHISCPICTVAYLEVGVESCPPFSARKKTAMAIVKHTYMKTRFGLPSCKSIRVHTRNGPLYQIQNTSLHLRMFDLTHINVWPHSHMSDPIHSHHALFAHQCRFRTCLHYFPHTSIKCLVSKNWKFSRSIRAKIWTRPAWVHIWNPSWWQQSSRTIVD